ncbi:MAG: NAD(P)-binding domain-containing protein [Chloroflexota bacterium]
MPAADADGRPFPPGAYPLIVVGSGPGALQVSHALRSTGVEHAVISADPSPGGMFRRWPFFQRLLSWTKPYAPEQRGTHEYERYDWNSLLSDRPELRSLQTEFMDGSSYFPSRPEMEQNLSAFAARAGVVVRHDTLWQRTRREEGPGGTTFVLGTTDGEYRTPLLVVAVGVAQPHSPSTPGIEHARHYALTRTAAEYAGRRVFIIGKQNSGFELASGLAAWASRIVLSSPSPAKLSVLTRSLVGVRARYVQPFEDHFLGFGVSILDAALEQITPVEGGLRIGLRRTDNGAAMSVEADDVIAATGFTCPLQDLPDVGVTTFGASGLPALTPFWESVSVPGIYFAGTITQAAGGLKKHGMPANSGAVHGHRYNGRILAATIAERHFGIPRPSSPIAERDLVDFLLDQATRAPELWHQKAYLARVVTLDPEEGIRDMGVQPLAHVLDSGGPDAVVMTVEADGSGAIFPVVYTRRDGAVEEHPLEPHPLLDYRGQEHRRALADVVGRVVPAFAGAIRQG